MGAQARQLVGSLRPEYTRLFDRAVEVLSADPRVEAAWLHGSTARGEADVVSDLDIIIAVDDAEIADFGAGWRERLEAITPTVMARRIDGPGGSWISITPDCLRFDLWVEAAGEVVTSPVAHRVPIVDRAALGARLAPPLAVPAGPDPAELDRLREWSALCEAVVAGGDRLLRIDVGHTLRWILYLAYAESNKPVAAVSMKRMSAKLTAQQLDILESLPTDDEIEPTLAVIDDVLGPWAGAPPPADLARAITPPEGFVRVLHLEPLPPRERARHIAEEFFALHLYLTVAAHRDDWVLGGDGVWMLRKLLYELDLEQQRRPSATAPSDWSGRLTDDQRAELLALPTGGLTREAAIAGQQAVREAFVIRGRALLGENWPAAMEKAVTDYVDEFVG